ncbi:MAG TPA: peptidylprolyl isomerase [Bacteroides sp.]|nr:peptidylprolyl isomerase [Phocaeicola coprophilus]HBB07821.1 peptidylprolyl isomerase [Bacteroides sp.]
MRKLLSIRVLLLLGVWMVSSLSHAQDNIIDEVVWVVGDEAILKSDIEQARLQAQYQGIKFSKDPYCVIPEQMAVQKLFLHQAEIDSIEVADTDVLSMVDKRINYYVQQVGSKEKFEEYMNMTSTQIREKWREEVRNEMIADKMKQEIVGDIKVTPAQVRRYFNQLPPDSIPYIPTQVEVQIITQQPKIPQAEIDRVKARLRDFTERITSGETQFSTLARLYSEDPGTARQGGEMDFMGRGQLVPEFAAVAFNLTDPKKVSKVVETEYGFHIIQLIEKRGDRIKVRHILLKPQVSEEDLNASVAHLDSIANDIRTGKFTFESAALYLSDDKNSKNNNGLMPNSATGTSRFEMGQLPQEIAVVVDKMNIGEISEAFTMIDAQNGKEKCAIVKLKTRIPGHKATITDDYQRLKAVVLEKLQNEKIQKWIAEKQKTTYVRINEKWKNCDFEYPGWIH